MLRVFLRPAVPGFWLAAAIAAAQPPPTEPPPAEAQPEQPPPEEGQEEQAPQPPPAEAKPEEAASEEAESGPAPEPPPTPTAGILPANELAAPSPGFRDPIVQVARHGDGLVVRTRTGRVVVYAPDAVSARWAPSGDATRFIGVRDDSLFLLGDEGRLQFRNLRDGSEVAARTLAPPPPAGIVGSAGGFLLAGGEGALFGYAPETGERRFEIPLPGGAARTMTARSGLLAVALDGGAVLLAERHGSALRERWRREGVGTVETSLLLLPERGLLVVGTMEGDLLALRLDDGCEAWSWALQEAFRHAPGVGERFLFAASGANTLYAFDVGGGSERWRAALPGRPAASPLTMGNRLLVATRDGLALEFDPRTGHAAGGYQDVGAEIVGVVAGVDDSDWRARRLYLGLRDGRFLVLAPRGASRAEEPEPPDRLPPVMESDPLRAR